MFAAELLASSMHNGGGLIDDVTELLSVTAIHSFVRPGQRHTSLARSLAHPHRSLSLPQRVQPLSRTSVGEAGDGLSKVSRSFRRN